MNESPASWWRRLARRVIPATLGGRLVGTVALLTLVVSGVTIVVDTSIVAVRAGAEGMPASAVGVALFSTAVGTLVATTAGIVLGLWIARIAGRPIERMVEHVKTEGRRALDEGEYAHTGAMTDASLPDELADLGAVVDDVLGRLAQRQTELLEAVAKAESAEETLGMVVRGSLDAHILLDGKTILLANPAAALALGSSPEALSGRSILEALSGLTLLDDHGEPADPCSLARSALENPVGVHLERGGAEARSYVLHALRPLESDPDRLLLTARHVSEELRTRRIRSEIVELVSHDLRAPLAVITGYLDLLRRPLDIEERTRAADAAKRDARRMSSLLEDLLSATQAEELLAVVELESVTLAELAVEVVSSLVTAHPGRDLAVETHGPSSVLGDAKRLRQALVNLVTNALAYSPEDAPVTVRVSSADARVGLAVVDHGPGVPEDQRELVFERYARLDGPSRGQPGFGLGLYIVRVIAENHGGRVRVVDTPGGGATFVIDLPLAANSGSACAPETETPSA